MREKILILGLAFLILVSMTFAETETGKINKGKVLIWDLVTDYSNQVLATAMWNKKGTDLDLVFFLQDENDEIIFLGVGLAQTDCFEQILIGLPSYSSIYVSLLSMSGPRAKYQINVQRTSSENIYKQSMHFMGEYDIDGDYIARKLSEKIKTLKK